MTADRALKVMNWGVLAVVVAAGILGLACLSGCASLWQSTKSAAAPAGGGAAGAAVGSLMGPGGAIIGAGVGAMVGDSVEENASLRAGETVGEGALENEIARWKGKAREAAASASAAEAASAWLWTAMKWGAVGFAAWFLFRNRHNIRDLGLWNGMIHSLGGGGIGKALVK